MDRPVKTTPRLKPCTACTKPTRRDSPAQHISSAVAFIKPHLHLVSEHDLAPPCNQGLGFSLINALLKTRPHKMALLGLQGGHQHDKMSDGEKQATLSVPRFKASHCFPNPFCCMAPADCHRLYYSHVVMQCLVGMHHESKLREVKHVCTPTARSPRVCCNTRSSSTARHKHVHRT